MIDSLEVGGAEKSVINIAIGLKKYSCANIVIFCLKNTGSLSKFATENGIIVKSFNVKRLFDKNIFNVFCALRVEKPDILHTHMFNADFIGRILGKMAKISVIVSTYHAPSTWKKSKDPRKVIKKYFDVFTSFFSDSLFSTTDSVGKYQIEVGKLPAKKFITIYNCINMEDYNNDRVKKYNKNNIVLIMIGRLHPLKQHVVFLDVFKEFLKEFPFTRLLILGDGQCKGDIKDKIKLLGIDKNVEVLGEQIDVIKYLNISDYFILPSQSEGLPMVILEAMAAKVPVISTKVGGIPDIIYSGFNGFLVDNNDLYKINQFLKILINNNGIRKSVIVNAFNFVESKFSQQAISCLLINHYNKLLMMKKRRFHE